MVELGRWNLRNKTHKKMLVGLLVVLAGISVVCGSYYAWLINPPPTPQSAEQALATIGTSRYQRMPDYRQREYLAQTRRLFEELPQDERITLFERSRTDQAVRRSIRQLREQMMVQRVIEYAQADPQTRSQILDKQIDRWQKMRSDRASRNRDLDKNRSRRRPEFHHRIQNYYEHGNPQINSLISEYFRAMRQRRAERGMISR